MQVSAVALYPLRLSQLAGKPGVRFRRRKKAEGTLVPCHIACRDGRSVAVPQFEVPDGTPQPLFKLQLETARLPVDDRRFVCALLAAESEHGASDPEQLMLSPIFDDGHVMIFEFRRAMILTVGRKRDVELRLVAVHTTHGTIGTKTIYRFNTRYLPLVGRCQEYLSGAIDLYPPPERFVRPLLARIPEGEANLSFGSRGIDRR